MYSREEYHSHGIRSAISRFAIIPDIRYSEPSMAKERTEFRNGNLIDVLCIMDSRETRGIQGIRVIGNRVIRDIHYQTNLRNFKHAQPCLSSVMPELKFFVQVWNHILLLVI